MIELLWKLRTRSGNSLAMEKGDTVQTATDKLFSGGIVDNRCSVNTIDSQLLYQPVAQLIYTYLSSYGSFYKK